MADGGWWLPDPTGRCDFRFRRVDGTFTDQVTSNGVPLVDPWDVATANRRPTEPWPVGARYCWRCKRGAVAGEERCTRCGGTLTSSQTQEAEKAWRRRSNRKALIITACAFLLVVGGVAVVGLVGESSPPGEASAASSCSAFRQGVLSAGLGTSTAAEADKALSKARDHAQSAAALNSDYRHLLVLLTSVANGGDDGLATLAECRRLGL